MGIKEVDYSVKTLILKKIKGEITCRITTNTILHGV